MATLSKYCTDFSLHHFEHRKVSLDQFEVAGLNFFVLSNNLRRISRRVICLDSSGYGCAMRELSRQYVLNMTDNILDYRRHRRRIEQGLSLIIIAIR
jgi:hypothetical protein